MGIITIAEAVTLAQASKSVLPLQIAEIMSRITAPIKRPIIAAMIYHTNNITPTAPPKSPPVIPPILRKPHIRAITPATTP